jgi:RNA polymerase sigma-70 factor (ECF subfamily)
MQKKIHTSHHFANLKRLYIERMVNRSLLISEYFEKYHSEMQRTMTLFSGDSEMAGDAVQHAFVKALENSGLLEQMPEKAAKAWLFSAARNAVIDNIRKNLWVTCFEDPPEMENDPAYFEEQILTRDLIEKLPEDLAEIVALRYISGLTSFEIGRLLDLPASTVRYRLAMAIRQLRAALF